MLIATQIIDNNYSDIYIWILKNGYIIPFMVKKSKIIILTYLGCFMCSIIFNLLHSI